MKCPHCGDGISLFCKSMNCWTRNRLCPSCRQPVRMFVSFKRAVLLLIPTAALLYALRPVIMDHGLGTIATWLPTALTLYFSRQLKAA
jgi:hypothetical protein